MTVKNGLKGGTRRPLKRPGGKRGLSLHPLPFEVAVAAALKTGTVPKDPGKPKKAEKGQKP